MSSFYFLLRNWQKFFKTAFSLFILTWNVSIVWDSHSTVSVITSGNDSMPVVTKSREKKEIRDSELNVWNSSRFTWSLLVKIWLEILPHDFNKSWHALQLLNFFITHSSPPSPTFQCCLALTKWSIFSSNIFRGEKQDFQVTYWRLITRFVLILFSGRFSTSYQRLYAELVHRNKLEHAGPPELPKMLKHRRISKELKINEIW